MPPAPESVAVSALRIASRQLAADLPAVLRYTRLMQELDAGIAARARGQDAFCALAWSPLIKAGKYKATASVVAVACAGSPNSVYI